ncbi:hypothetical protein [Nonomuraea dietziae]|uniref:hypothetical protein n=1 Tax=Nonomuraea dietziae TaxID=65515 RepID=UPI00343926BF
MAPARLLRRTDPFSKLGGVTKGRLTYEDRRAHSQLHPPRRGQGRDPDRPGRADRAGRGAPVLLLDEATAALDTGNERAVVGALEAGGQGRATLIIAHRLSTIARADQIIFLDAGRVVESGTRAELLSQGGRFAAYWRQRERAAGWTLAKITAPPSPSEDPERPLIH